MGSSINDVTYKMYFFDHSPIHNFHNLFELYGVSRLARPSPLLERDVFYGRSYVAITYGDILQIRNAKIDHFHPYKLDPIDF